MSATLKDVKRAIQGLIMSPELDEMYSAFQRLPSSDESELRNPKSLGAWVKDLIARVNFFRDWLHLGQPAAFDLCIFLPPGLCFVVVARPRLTPSSPPMNGILGFMTGSLQTGAKVQRCHRHSDVHFRRT